ATNQQQQISHDRCRVYASSYLGAEEGRPRSGETQGDLDVHGGAFRGNHPGRVRAGRLGQTPGLAQDRRLEGAELSKGGLQASAQGVAPQVYEDEHAQRRQRALRHAQGQHLPLHLAPGLLPQRGPSPVVSGPGNRPVQAPARGAVPRRDGQVHPSARALLRGRRRRTEDRLE
ncbi:unnamed protein product, partial [Laminaria digitata]